MLRGLKRGGGMFSKLLTFLLVSIACFGQAIVTNNSVNVIGSLPTGSNLIGKVGLDQTTPGTTNAVSIAYINTTAVDANTGNASNGTLRVVIASNQPALSVSPPVTCGGSKFSQQWAAVPTSATLLTTATTSCLFTLAVTNTNSSTQTFTLTDNTATPINVVGPAFVIPGLSTMIWSFGGVPFNLGIKWSAGGTGVTGAATWVQ